MKHLVTAAVVSFLATGPARAENVEVFLVDMLDNIQNGYCLDIAKGRGADANPEDGLQAHTCYSPLGKVLVDQAFAPEQLAKGVLFMPEFDVCVQASSTEVGAALELAECDGGALQNWAFDGNGTIAPASAPEVCMTLTGETRLGRSKENQMRALTLQACSDADAALQIWSHRTAE